MAEQKPPRLKYIQVQASNDEEENISQSRGKNDNAINKHLIANRPNDNTKFFPITCKPPVTKVRFAEIEQSFREVEISNHIQDMFLARVAKVNKEKNVETKEECVEEKHVKGKKKKNKKNGRKGNNRVLPLGDSELKPNEKAAADHNDRIESDVAVENDEKKKKKTNTKKKKKRNENKANVEDQPTKEKILEIEEATEEDATGHTNKQRKLPCLFGFISTWLAKRKERRRDKKMEYDRRTARGGEAFTIEVDNRL